MTLNRFDETAAAGLPKLCGSDVELGNFILGIEDARVLDTCQEASRALLREIDGLPLWTGAFGWYAAPAHDSSRADTRWTGDLPRSGSSSVEPGRVVAWPTTSVTVAGGSDISRDWGRRYLPGNGGCAYIDLNHLELCIPEVLSARAYVAHWHAMLRIARRAQARAQERLPEGQRLQVLVNNTDGKGHAYGSHLNFLIARKTWEDLFHRKLQHLLTLAAYQVSSIVFTGAGKVGAENGHDWADFQIAQRADFFERLTSVETTFNRGIVNARDEALCGSRWGARDVDPPADSMARLHVIFYDNTLAHVSSFLKVGVMQIVLAMLEQGRLDRRFTLDDPLAALHAWSRDPSLTARARLESGGETTAVELQLRFFEAAREFVEAGGCDGTVPEAGTILALWGDTLEKLGRRDYGALAPRLDWCMKYLILQRAFQQRSDLDWESPVAKHLDHSYSSLDPEDGIYWSLERSDGFERIVDDAAIDRAMVEPPADTRAWTRATLLRLADPESIDEVDWDLIRFRFWDSQFGTIRRTVRMSDPLSFTAAQTAPLIESGGSIDDLLDEIDRIEERRNEP
ncbi:MAG: hypothetical protein GF328_13785 [Candidatus Latescibacteria bacterium]|nr:hypothetical protein [Candidatus Latescibacterota bacterium]